MAVDYHSVGRSLYVLAALLILLIALVLALLARQGRASQAKLGQGETERIVAAVHSDLTRVQGETSRRRASSSW